jgi:hypothetical protein
MHRETNSVQKTVGSISNLARALNRAKARFILRTGSAGSKGRVVILIPRMREKDLSSLRLGWINFQLVPTAALCIRLPREMHANKFGQRNFAGRVDFAAGHQMSADHSALSCGDGKMNVFAAFFHGASDGNDFEVAGADVRLRLISVTDGGLRKAAHGAEQHRGLIGSCRELTAHFFFCKMEIQRVSSQLRTEGAGFRRSVAAEFV